MKNHKDLNKVFFEKACYIKEHAKNSRWRERKHSAFSGVVLDIEEDAGTKNLSILLNKGEQIKFMPGAGVGIPGEVDRHLVEKIVSNLSCADTNEQNIARKLISTTVPYPSILLTAPDIKLLKLIEQKLSLSQGSNKFHKRLKEVIEDHEKFERLQATYDVSDILHLFPGLITKEELAETQGPSHGNKTFCVFDCKTITFNDKTPRQCFKISVLPEGGVYTQNLFDEKNKKTLHLGEVSNYLYNLKVGDQLYINNKPKHKKDFALPADLSSGMVFLGQGNGASPFLSMFRTLQDSKGKGHRVQGVHLILAARDISSIWGLKHIEPYLDSGLIESLDIALSETDPAGGIEVSPSCLPITLRAQALERVRLHHGTRLVEENEELKNRTQGLFEPKVKAVIETVLRSGGHLFISSGAAFKNTIETAALDIASLAHLNLTATEKQIKASDSKARVQGIDKGWSIRVAGNVLKNYLTPKP